jgi:hypothetical protein
MDALVHTYDGHDLVISSDEMEKLGLKPGDKLVSRPEVRLVPRKFSPEELERRKKILDEITGSWTAEDEEAYRRNREAMWATWQPRNWS